MVDQESKEETHLSDKYTFDDYVKALYLRKWLLLFVVVSAGLGSAVFSGLVTPIYEAKAVFYVPNTVSDPSNILGYEDWQAAVPSASLVVAEAYAQMLHGKDALVRVVEEFPSLTVDKLRRNVHARGNRQGLVTVLVRDTDPARAASVANALVRYFNEFIRRPVNLDSDQALSRIGIEIEDTDNRLAEAIDEKKGFLERNNVASPETELRGLQEEYLGVQFELRRNEVLLDAIDSQRRTLQEQFDRQAGIFETSKLREQLILLAAKREATEAQIAGLKSLIRETQARIGRVTEFAAELERRDDFIESYMDQKRSLQSVRNNLGIGSLQSRQAGLFVETADPPDSAVFPLIWLNVLVASLLGLFTGIFYVFLLEGLAIRRRQQRLRNIASEKWVREILQVPPLRNADGE